MSVSRDLLEGQLQDYEMQLKSLKSYLKELNHATAEHGTDREHFEGDLFEAEHNVKYYEDEVARLRGEIGKLEKAPGAARGGAAAMLPQTVRQGVGSLILSTISFGAGALLGSRMRPRPGGGARRAEAKSGTGD